MAGRQHSVPQSALLSDPSSDGPFRQTTNSKKAPGCDASGDFRLFQHMLQAHFQNGLHMVIRQGIEDVLALPAEFDQMHLL